MRTVTSAVPPSDGHVVAAGDDLLAEQVGYYRRRASEYDVTAYGDVDAAPTRITRVVAAPRPAGNVLEIACRTCLWTSALAGVASPVTAIDAAPEAVDIARGRVKAANVRFEVADVFSWLAAARFDTVLFACWLSHVPASRFEQFWRQLRGLVTGHGGVPFVDEHRFGPGWPWVGLAGEIPQEPLGFQPSACLLTNALMTIILSAGA